MMLNLKPFFSGRYEESTKGTFEGCLGCGLWVILLGMRKKAEKIFQESEVNDRNVALSTSQKYLVQISSVQWREDMRKTPNVILGCFRGLGKK